MAKYRVYLEANVSLAVTVDIDDTGKDADEIEDIAIAAAYDTAPADICAQCSGWREPWSRDIGEYEPVNENPVEKVEG